MNRRDFVKGLFCGISLLAFRGALANVLALEPVEPLALTEAQWKKRLTPLQFTVLRKAGTEDTNSSPLIDEKRAGVYACAGCDLPLFLSEWKFDSHTGWPSFYKAVPGHIKTQSDIAMMIARIEYHCVKCGGHQGHVFDDGPHPTGLRYCNNGVALNFKPAA